MIACLLVLLARLPVSNAIHLPVSNDKRSPASYDIRHTLNLMRRYRDTPFADTAGLR
jgi:hypothetical protein